MEVFNNIHQLLSSSSGFNIKSCIQGNPETLELVKQQLESINEPCELQEDLLFVSPHVLHLIEEASIDKPVIVYDYGYSTGTRGIFQLDLHGNLLVLEVFDKSRLPFDISEWVRIKDNVYTKHGGARQTFIDIARNVAKPYIDALTLNGRAIAISEIP